MDASDTRRELAASVRLLVGHERWLFVGLLAGGLGYLVWLAGTGVAVSNAVEAALGPVSVDPWSSEATVLAAAFALLWVVVPALAAVWFLVGALTNIRGNVEQCYRLDRPLVLLVPPLVALGAVAAAVVARGSVSTPLLAAAGVASGFLLVRTVAYGYRVYSLSVPRLLQALLLVAAVVASLAVVSRTGSLTGQETLVEALAERYGVGDVAFGTTSRSGFSAPTLPLVAAATPAVLALAYVWVQLFASLVVRIRRPDVPRSAIRAGQRYPAVVQPGTSRSLAMGTGGGSDASGSAGGNASPSDGDGDGTESASVGPSDSAGGTDGPGPASADGDGGDADAFGQTRVYTPPEDASVDGDVESTDVLDGEEAVKNELCPICGATYEATGDRTQCPNCDAVLDPE